MKLSEPIALTTDTRAWVYRLWNADGDCLYVGQHKGIHPASRIQHHRSQSWWNEVDRADYVEVLDGDLYEAELSQIIELEAKYNRENYGFWRTTCGRPQYVGPKRQPLGQESETV